MLARTSAAAARALRASPSPHARCFSSVAEKIPVVEGGFSDPKLSEIPNPLYETAQSALNSSCYLSIDWKISEDKPVIEAIHRMVANKIGALAVTGEGDGIVKGIVTERDYLNKVAFLGKNSSETTISEISTSFPNLVTVSRENPIDRCMEKMLAADVRHLLVRAEKDKNSEIMGMISVKDIVKCNLAKSNAQKERLESIIIEQQFLNSPI